MRLSEGGSPLLQKWSCSVGVVLILMDMTCKSHMMIHDTHTETMYRSTAQHMWVCAAGRCGARDGVCPSVAGPGHSCRPPRLLRCADATQVYVPRSLSCGGVQHVRFPQRSRHVSLLATNVDGACAHAHHLAYLVGLAGRSPRLFPAGSRTTHVYSFHRKLEVLHMSMKCHT